MRRRRSAKIVATLGPASSTPELIRALFDAGVDVFRLNFSHGTHEDHRARFAAIRAIESMTGRPIGILADLQGPKLRLGTFSEGRIGLAAGAPFRLDLDRQPGDETRAPLPHPEIFEAIQTGTELLLDDGKVRLRVETCGTGFADTLCLVGGSLSDRKGVNVPNAVLPLSAVTEKDRADLAFAIEQGADWVAFSFVQRPDDVAEGRKLVAGRAGVMVKLEKPSAIERLSEIIELADGLMVARGDLGVEMPPEDVPSVQKQVIHACRAAGKPVVVATQMLESMIGSPTPTRAEASDVATAVYEGADAVMLSAATALRAARERPAAPILVLTSNLNTARRLAVLWGAHCVHTSDVKSFGDMVQKAVRIAHREGIAEPGQRVVITAGVPFGTPGATNTLRIAWVDR